MALVKVDVASRLQPTKAHVRAERKVCMPSGSAPDRLASSTIVCHKKDTGVSATNAMKNEGA